ncbi:MAG TPA: tetratricopeptide repeat protein [Opitutales bacterium]|nr:tetratricopeptide repeat protein [Opitutales bacterium]
MKWISKGALFALVLLTSYQGVAGPSSLGETTLQAIVTQEDALWAELDDSHRTLTEGDMRRKVLDIQRSYQSFVDAHTTHFEGIMLYGKFLRKVDAPHIAHDYFQKAAALNPNVAVVHQQLANYYAEKGRHQEAFSAITRAIELEPSIAIYYYQLGELLYVYQKEFIQDSKWNIEYWDSQMLGAFEKAYTLDPKNQTLELRYAQSFFDLEIPRWPEALAAWSTIEKKTPVGAQQEYVFTQKARVLIELNRYQEAKKYLDRVWRPELEHNRQILLKRISEADPRAGTE